MANERPPWLRDLSGNKTVEQWLDAVVNADDAAAVGLLRRHSLEGAQTRAERQRTVASALDDGLLSVADLERWRDDVIIADCSVGDISQFRSRAPWLESFWRERDQQPGTVAEMEERARQALWRGDLDLRRDWLGFWDPRRDHTDRHVFLFELPPGPWQELGQSDGLAARLRQLDRGDLLSHEEFPWHPESPRLVAANLDLTTRVLNLRWVAWRPEEGLQHPRAVQFARLDVHRRALELQLQRRQLGGMHGRTEERDLYIEAVAKLLDCRPRLVSLEPAMRRFLDHDQLVLDRWRVRLPSGGELQGSKEPGLFSKVQLALRRHYALEIKGRWETIGDQHPLVNLDARTDCIDVFWQCPPTDLHELVTEIRTAASEAPTVEAPTADAEPAPVSPDTGTPDQSEATNRPATQADRLEDAELGRLMQRLMRYLRRLGHRRLEVGELWSQVTAGDMLSTTGTLRAAVEKVGVQHLGASFYIICPGTGTPVTQNGKMLTFERLADVPKAVMCENEAGDPLEHQTADNVWLQVRAPSDSRRFSPLKAAAGIAIIFALLTLGSLYFLERFPDHKYFIYAGYTLAVLAPLAALFRLYGRDAAEWAAGLMEKVAGMLRRPQR